MLGSKIFRGFHQGRRGLEAGRSGRLALGTGSSPVEQVFSLILENAKVVFFLGVQLVLLSVVVLMVRVLKVIVL